jgi:hypothetical protein
MLPASVRMAETSVGQFWQKYRRSSRFSVASEAGVVVEPVTGVTILALVYIAVAAGVIAPADAEAQSVVAVSGDH